jgi:hypothetical protein
VKTFDGTTPSSAAHMKLTGQLAGFTLDDCDPVRANSTAAAVRFAGGALSGLRGKSAVLLFQLCDADLFGFRFV